MDIFWNHTVDIKHIIAFVQSALLYQLFPICIKFADWIHQDLTPLHFLLAFAVFLKCSNAAIYVKEKTVLLVSIGKQSAAILKGIQKKSCLGISC